MEQLAADLVPWARAVVPLAFALLTIVAIDAALAARAPSAGERA